MIGQAIAWPAIHPKMFDPLQRGVDASVAFFLLVFRVRALWSRGRLPARHTWTCGCAFNASVEGNQVGRRFYIASVCRFHIVAPDLWRHRQLVRDDLVHALARMRQREILAAREQFAVVAVERTAGLARLSWRVGPH